MNDFVVVHVLQTETHIYENLPHQIFCQVLVVLLLKERTQIAILAELYDDVNLGLAVVIDKRVVVADNVLRV